jgi:Holliday junction resolvase RusA-like endonuclease
MNQGFENISWTFEGDPIGKPRMTQSDKWAKRPCVERYRMFSDSFRLQMPDEANLAISEKRVIGVSWTAFIPMPASWSKKKRSALLLQHHQQKPDRDNIDKAILDTMLKDDSVVSFGTICKRWGITGRIDMVLHVNKCVDTNSK